MGTSKSRLEAAIKMTPAKMFTTFMISLMGIASIFYFATGDIRRGIYWACSCLINITVTY